MTIQPNATVGSAAVASTLVEPDSFDPAIGSSRNATNRVIRRTATVLSGIWMAGLIPAIISGGSGLRSTGLALVLLTLIVLAWFVCLILHLLPVTVYVAVISASVIVMTLNTYPVSLADPYAALVPWINLAALMAAMLLTSKWGSRTVFGIATSAFVVIMSVAFVSGDLPDTWGRLLLMAVYPMAIGMAAVGTVRAWVTVAETSDRAAAQRLEAIAQEERERVGRQERFSIARLLHDTVINTFGAIRDGSSAIPNELVQQRCVLDIAALERATQSKNECKTVSVASSAGAYEAYLVAFALQRAGVLNVELTISVSGTCPELPENARSAICGAVGEALLNVSKHAGTNRAKLTINCSADAFEVNVRDYGDGFVSADAPVHPKPESISERCARAGVMVKIESPPGGGTQVVLSWHPRLSETVPQQQRTGILLDSLIPTAKWLTYWLVGLFVVNTVIVVGSEPVAGSLAAVIMLGLVIWAAIWASTKSVPIPWFVSGLLVLAAGLVAYLPASGTPGCARIGLGWWGSLGGTFCVVMLVLLSGQVVWIVAGCVTYLIGIAALIVQITPEGVACVVDSMPAILMTDVAFVLALVAFRRLLIRYGDQAERSQAETAEAMKRVVAMREHERVRMVNLERVLKAVRPLLSGLADGSIDPSDQTVRLRCANDETYLRSLIQIDPDQEALGFVLTDAVQTARSQGRSLSIRSAERVAEPRVDALRRIHEILSAVIDILSRDREAVVTLFTRSNGAAMTILVPVEMADAGVIPQFHSFSSDDLLVTELTEDDQLLIELSWKRD